MTLRKVKSMVEILNENPDSYFTIDGALNMGCHSYFIPPERFVELGKHIDTKISTFQWLERWLHPLPKKKTIKLFRYFYQTGLGSFEFSNWTSRHFKNICHGYDFELLKTEEKEIEVDDL